MHALNHGTTVSPPNSLRPSKYIKTLPFLPLYLAIRILSLQTSRGVHCSSSTPAICPWWIPHLHVWQDHLLRGFHNSHTKRIESAIHDQSQALFDELFNTNVTATNVTTLKGLREELLLGKLPRGDTTSLALDNKYHLCKLFTTSPHDERTLMCALDFCLWLLSYTVV
jgi:hypothetical protein